MVHIISTASFLVLLAILFAIISHKITVGVVERLLFNTSYYSNFCTQEFQNQVGGYEYIHISKKSFELLKRLIGHIYSAESHYKDCYVKRNVRGKTYEYVKFYIVRNCHLIIMYHSFDEFKMLSKHFGSPYQLLRMMN